MPFHSRGEKMKSPFASKLNWIGAAIAILGLMTDPTFQKYMADLIPQDIMSKIISLSGILVIVIRTFFTSQGMSIGDNKQESQ